MIHWIPQRSRVVPLDIQALPVPTRYSTTTFKNSLARIHQVAGNDGDHPDTLFRVLEFYPGEKETIFLFFSPLSALSPSRYPPSVPFPLFLGLCPII